MPLGFFTKVARCILFRKAQTRAEFGEVMNSIMMWEKLFILFCHYQLGGNEHIVL